VEWSVSEDEVFCACGGECEWRGGPAGKCTRATRYILWKPVVQLRKCCVEKLGGVFFLRGGRCVTLKVPVTTSPKSPLASGWWSTASNARRKSTDAREPYARTCFIGGDASA